MGEWARTSQASQDVADAGRQGSCGLGRQLDAPSFRPVFGVKAPLKRDTIFQVEVEAPLTQATPAENQETPSGLPSPGAHVNAGVGETP